MDSFFSPVAPTNPISRPARSHRSLLTLIFVAVAAWQTARWTAPTSPPPTPSGPGDLTRQWINELPRLTRTAGGRLEVSEVRVREDFADTNERHLFGVLPLGTTSARVQVAATFHYALPLAHPAWEVRVEGNVCVVNAPELEALLPVAFVTADARRAAESGWGRGDKAGMLAALERGITIGLTTRSMDTDHLALARENARHTVAEFVSRWLLHARPDWREDATHAVRVFFPGEESAPASSEPPTGPMRVSLRRG